VKAEWHRLREAVVHRPGIEMFFGLLEPSSFLYDRFFSMDEAVFEHKGLEHTLSKIGVEVKRLKSLFIDALRKKESARAQVAKKVSTLIKYVGFSAESAKKSFLEALDSMDPETLFNLLLLNPTVETRARKSEEGKRVIYPFVKLGVPLANLYYLRDQQAATDIGMVYGRMAKPQRRREVFITKVTFEASGHKTAWSVRAPGTFEGGDFMPAGDFALIGEGDRTNLNGILQVMRHGVGYEEIAVVHYPSHPLIAGDGHEPMLFMHLDTYFNFAGEGLAVGCGTLLDHTLVDVYHKKRNGKYEKEESGVKLYTYIRNKGFDVIKLTNFEQLALAPNFLTVDDRKIVAVDVERNIDATLKKIERLRAQNPEKFSAFCDHALREYQELKLTREFFPRKKALEEQRVEAIPLDLYALTGGYGGARCMVASIRRD
jgi:Arginine deiminase